MVALATVWLLVSKQRQISLPPTLNLNPAVETQKRQGLIECNNRFHSWLQFGFSTAEQLDFQSPSW